MILRGNVYSTTLNVNTGLSVVTPDDVPAQGACKTVYLLHGLHGDHNTWVDNTLLPIFAKEYNAVFIMPEVGRSFYTDMRYGLKYFTYISEELPRICRGFFNLSAAREDTAIMGCSMGGYGALKCALAKPEQYGFCGAISSACLFFKTILENLHKDTSPWIYSGIPQAEAILQDFYAIFGSELTWNADEDVQEMVKRLAGAPVKPVIYATCGTGDKLREDNIQFRDWIQQFNFNFTYEEWEGIHDWFFFSEALKKTLEKWALVP